MKNIAMLMDMLLDFLQGTRNAAKVLASYAPQDSGPASYAHSDFLTGFST